MGTPFRALRTENRELKFRQAVAIVGARRAANRRAFWRLVGLSCGLGMIVGMALTLVLIATVR